MANKCKTQKLGQYFTTDLSLKLQLFALIKNNPIKILEPSIGRGDLVTYVSQQFAKAGHTIEFDLYELDNTIEFLPQIDKTKIIFGDFLEQSSNNTTKYTTIIGNPPYVKTSSGNLYVKFIEKCFNMLANCGELIFIVPSEIFKLTQSAKLLVTMMESGTFTDIYHPHNEKLFENANIDVLIFRYCKDISLPKRVEYNGVTKSIINSNGLITFADITKDTATCKTIGDYFDVYVGIVSGKDEVYKNTELGNISVINGENKIDKYILINTYPSDNPDINTYLEQHKTSLISRKIKKFTEKNWWQWGALRNITVMLQKAGTACIYVNNLTRSENIAFQGTVGYFGGGLLMMIPKNVSIDLGKVVDYLNTESFKDNFIFSGRFKIGHRQLVNSIIDAKLIGDSSGTSNIEKGKKKVNICRKVQQN